MGPPRPPGRYPRSQRSAPITQRANSERPAPTSPASPTISPAFTDRLTPCTTSSRQMSDASSTTSASGGGRCLGTYICRNALPTIFWIKLASSSSPTGDVLTRFPSLSTDTVSAVESTSCRWCDTIPMATSLLMRRRRVKSRSARRTSSDEVGSSRMSTRG